MYFPPPILYPHIQFITFVGQIFLEMILLYSNQESHREVSKQCPQGPDGFHEMMECKNKSLLCIHCGLLVNLSERTKEELKKHFKEKKFDKRQTQPPDPDDLPF